MSKIYESITPEEKRMLRMATFKSGLTSSSFNFVKMMGQGYAMCMMPFNKKYYKTDEEANEAIIRSNTFFNTNNMMLPFILGINIAMEKERAKNPQISADTIASAKTSLMGPLAGIGDSFQFNTLRIIAAGVGISLAAQGNVLGPLLFILLYFLPYVIIRDRLIFIGYTLGADLIEKLFSGGMLKRVTKAASVIGVIMVGALVAQMVNVTTTLTFSMGGGELSIQQVLDSIMPGMLSIGLIFGVIAMIKKRIKPVAIVFGIMGACILGSFFGIF
ncbi:PTS system mannose/fructose/sorbose family transporter subunit IID [Oscillospiraceae bacterium PP1C4]